MSCILEMVPVRRNSGKRVFSYIIIEETFTSILRSFTSSAIFPELLVFAFYLSLNMDLTDSPNSVKCIYGLNHFMSKMVRCHVWRVCFIFRQIVKYVYTKCVNFLSNCQIIYLILILLSD